MRPCSECGWESWTSLPPELRILLVEDNELYRLHLRGALQGQGVELKEAPDLASGLQALEQNEFDCGVVDLQLPDGDGRQLLSAELEFPIVFLTGTTEETTIIQAIRAGAEDYLVKTAIAHNLGQELLLAIRKAIERFARRRELSQSLQMVHWRHIQLERQVEERNELYKLAPVGYLALDPTARVLEANEAASHMLDCGLPLLIGMPVVSCLSRESMVPCLRHLWRSLAGEDCDALQVDARQSRRLQLSFVRATETTVRVGLIDLTRQMRMREAMAVSAGAARGLSEETTLGVLEMRSDGTIEAGNTAAEDLFGAVDWQGRKLADVLIGCHLREGRYECLGRGRDGRAFQAEVSVTRTRNSGPDRWIALVHDLSQDWRAVGHLVDLAEAEKRRLGQELHDNLGQRLAAMSFVAGSLNRRLKDGNPEVAALAHRLMELCQQAIVETRSLAQGLYPPELETHGLLSALRRLGQDLEQIFGIRCRMELVDCGFAPGQPSLHVYRIVQEALNNAVKHGEANHIEVRLTRVNQQVLLCIEDDGLGLDQNAPESARLGLLGMRHHCQMLGGTLELIPNQPTGVVVRCLLPSP